MTHIAWHRKGTYLATSMSAAVKHAVLIHKLPQRQTLAPFQKMKGSVQRVQFHPSRPYLLLLGVRLN